MSSISVSDSTKDEFDQLKPDNLTHDEFAQELLAAYRRDNGEIVNIDSIIEEIQQRVATNCEVAAYRGVKEGLDNE